MSSNNTIDPFRNLINSFKDIKFLESDNESCFSIPNEGSSHFERELEFINGPSLLEKYLSRPQSSTNSRKGDSSCQTGNNSPRSACSYYFDLNNLGKTLAETLEQGSIASSNKFSPMKFGKGLRIDLEPNEEFVEIGQVQDKVEISEEKSTGITSEENPFDDLIFKPITVTTLPEDQIYIENTTTDNEENIAENTANETSVQVIQSPQQAEQYYVLFANPTDMFYKKMSNERHYYIRQIANGSAGIFLEKADWKLEKQRLDIKSIKARIYRKARKIYSLLYNEQITIDNLNTKTIENALIDHEETEINLPESIEKKLEKAQESFEEYLIKNIYGKKKHAYKIPNAEELQKSILINKECNIQTHSANIFLKLSLRVLFEQFFNDHQLYNALVDKIIEHVNVEVDKKKKDTNEKLAELKKIFYKVNRKEFGQKFLDPPCNIKGMKATFKYTIPNEDVESLACDFVDMTQRIHNFDDKEKGEIEVPKALFYTDSKAKIDARKNNLWIAIPFLSQQQMEKTEGILKEREIPTMKGEIQDKINVDFEKEKPVIEFNEDTLDATIKFRTSDKAEAKKIKLKDGLKDKKGKMKEENKVILRCSTSIKRRHHELDS